MHRLIALLCILSTLAGCGTAPTPTPEPPPWSAPITLARAQQADPPVLWPETGGLAAAWVGADETGVHEDVVRLTNGGVGPVTVLPLPPRHPYALSGAPGANGDLHLLWLDANESGETRLFSALLTRDLTVERGPTAISDKLTLRYAVSPAANGSLWTAWSGDLASEPTLYAQAIDADGRPRPPIRVATDATEPALTRSEDGKITVYWLGASDGQVYRADLDDNGSGSIQALTASIHLEADDQLDSLRAGQDRSHAYLFWNVTRGDGSAETWLASGPLTASEWTQPRRLVLTLAGATLVTPWGKVAPTGASGAVVRRAGPLAGQDEFLPVVAQTEDRLRVLYFHNGGLAGVEDVAQATGLLAAPSLTLGADGGLVAAWSEPGTDGQASLKVAMKNAPPG